MLYGIQYRTVTGNILSCPIYEYEFKSEINTLFPKNQSEKSKKLQEEIQQYLDKKNPNTIVVIEEIEALYDAHFILKYKEYFREDSLFIKKLDYLFKESEDELRKYKESIEYDQDYSINLMLETIPLIKKIRFDAERYNLLDNQEYLSFLDTLNRLSIDQDRPDTIKGKES